MYLSFRFSSILPWGQPERQISQLCCNFVDYHVMWSKLGDLFVSFVYFDMIGSYVVVFVAIRRKSVSLSKFPFLSQVQVLSCETLFITPTKLSSFPFLFPCYCYSVVHRVFSIVSDGYNQSSFVFFYIHLKSLNRCINAVFNGGQSSSSLFSWYI